MIKHPSTPRFDDGKLTAEARVDASVDGVFSRSTTCKVGAPGSRKYPRLAFLSYLLVLRLETTGCGSKMELRRRRASGNLLSEVLAEPSDDLPAPSNPVIGEAEILWSSSVMLNSTISGRTTSGIKLGGYNTSA
jgi:hypothetical protein